MLMLDLKHAEERAEKEGFPLITCSLKICAIARFFFFYIDYFWIEYYNSKCRIPTLNRYIPTIKRTNAERL